MQVYLNWLHGNLLLVFTNIGNINLKLIVDVLTVFVISWFLLFLSSIILLYIIKYRLKKVPGYLLLSSPIIGFSILSIFYSFLHLFEIYGNNIILFFNTYLILNFLVGIYWIMEEKDSMKNFVKSNKILTFGIVSFLIPLWVYIIIIFPMVITGNSLYTPGYYVNHDSIVYETGALRLESSNASEPMMGGAFQNASSWAVSDNSHTGQLYLLNTFKSYFDDSGLSKNYTFYDMDYFELTHPLQIVFYSLVSIPLYLIFKALFKVEKKHLLIPALLGPVTVLTIQYLNQVSFSQNIIISQIYFVLFFLFFKFTPLLFKKLSPSEILLNNLSLIIITLGAMGYYGYTSLTWIFPALLFVSFLNIKKIASLFRTGIILLFSTFILGFPVVNSSYKLFALTTKSSTQEVSLFKMTGNMFGYPSVLNLFNSLLALDFRLQSVYPKITIIVAILFIILTIFILMKYRKDVRWIELCGLLLTFLVPILISRFYYQSPYILGKSLFYFAPFVLLLGIFAMINLLRRISVLTLFSIPVLVITIFNIFNSLLLISPPAIPLTISLREIDRLEIQGHAKERETIYIDDFDWGKYFLARFDPIVVYDRIFSIYSYSSMPYSFSNPIMLSQFNQTKISEFDNIIIANEFIDMEPEGYTIMYQDANYSVFAKE